MLNVPARSMSTLSEPEILTSQSPMRTKPFSSLHRHIQRFGERLDDRLGLDDAGQRGLARRLVGKRGRVAAAARIKAATGRGARAISSIIGTISPKAKRDRVELS